LRDRITLLAARAAEFPPTPPSPLGGEGGVGGLDYWDQVSLAEAELLRGRLAEARRLYRQAFADSGPLVGRVEVTRKQLGENLLALGLRGDVEEFLTRSRTDHPGRPILVGVTGHRKLPPGDALRHRVLEALEVIRGARGEEPVSALMAVSNLA